MRSMNVRYAITLFCLLLAGVLGSTAEGQTNKCFPDDSNPLNGFIDPNCVVPATQCICYYSVTVTPYAKPGDCQGCCNDFDGSYLCQYVGGTFASGPIDVTACAECKALGAQRVTCFCDNSQTWGFSVVCSECDT